MTGFSVARASGPSRISRPSRPSRPLQSGASQQAPQPATANPEIVALVPLGQSLAPAIQAGFGVIAQTEVATLSASVVRFALPQGRGLADAMAEVAQLLPGATADENHLYRPDDFICDGADCAAHAMIGWGGWPSAMRPRLGMIDTGINTDHPALTDRNLRVEQVDLADRAAAGRTHGTAIAAMLIGSINGRVPGLLPDAELIAVEAFHARGSMEQADAFSIVAAMDLLIGARVDVINLSFSGQDNSVLRRIIAQATTAGIGLVAAAGNGGPGAAAAYPAAWPEVIAVTAVDARGQVYRQANQGPYIALAAPGVNIWTAASISGGRLRSGTSYAAPFVTAALAVERMRQPEKDVAAVIRSLFVCAKDLGAAGFDPVFGHGLITSPEKCEGGAAFFPVGGE